MIEFKIYILSNFYKNNNWRAKNKTYESAKFILLKQKCVFCQYFHLVFLSQNEQRKQKQEQHKNKMSSKWEKAFATTKDNNKQKTIYKQNEIDKNLPEKNFLFLFSFQKYLILNVYCCFSIFFYTFHPLSHFCIHSSSQHIHAIFILLLTLFMHPFIHRFVVAFSFLWEAKEIVFSYIQMGFSCLTYQINFKNLQVIIFVVCGFSPLHLFI